jgi:Zn-dependent M32 family carboxypeptidase
MDLVERATGAPLRPDAFIAYVRQKYERVWAA